MTGVSDKMRGRTGPARGGNQDAIRQFAEHGHVGETREFYGPHPTLIRQVATQFHAGTYRTRRIPDGLSVTKLEAQS